MAANVKDLSDDDLFARFVGGCNASFDELYSRYKGELTRYLRGRGFVRDKAEDLQQEIWGEIVRSKSTRDGVDFRPWLFQVAEWAATKSRRSKKAKAIARHASIHDKAGELRIDPADPKMRRRRDPESNPKIGDAIRSLPDDQRQAVIARGISETREQAASVLGIGVDGFDKRMQKIKASLRAAIPEVVSKYEPLAPEPVA